MSVISHPQLGAGNVDRLALVGFMGCGKSTVGRHLASRRRWSFVDLDREIEKEAKSSIAEIFESQGEQAFRELEQTVLTRVLRGQGLVVATGGGTYCQPAGYDLLRRSCVTVWLDPAFKTILARLERTPGKRPLFQDASQAWALFLQRRPLYQRADIHVTYGPDDKPGQIARELAELLARATCAT